MTELQGLIKPDKGNKFSFFSGKGGVGKTTMSSATAVWLADRGYKTLLFSTDLQKSTNDIFQQHIGLDPTPINGVPNLWGVSIEVVETLKRHEGKMVDILKVIDSESVFVKEYTTEIEHPEECNCEKAALFEFMKYLGKGGDEYDAIVFDTAPTGQQLEIIRSSVNYTLNLASQVEHKKKLVEFFGKEEAEAQIKGLEERRDTEERAVKNLGGDHTCFVMILYPEEMPLAEVERNTGFLGWVFNIPVRAVIINNIIPEHETAGNAFWTKRKDMQKKYIDLTYEKFPDKVIAPVPMMATEVIGVERLRKVGAHLYGGNGGAGRGGK